MSYFSLTLRRRLFAIAVLADFSIIVNGVEYKPGDTVTITASTTVTVKGNGKAKVTLIGAGGGGAGATDSTLDYQGGDGGDGGTSIFTAELTSGNYSIVVGTGGKAGGVGTGSNGGGTTAFEHSASGGFGGSAATEWYDGSNGQDGTGETASGNDTAYGQGGNGDWYNGNAGGNGVCIIKIIDPNTKECIITLSGTFDSSSGYVIINGDKVITPGEYTVLSGEVVTLAVKRPGYSGAGIIKINGQQVISATTNLQTYDYTVESNCTITCTKTGSGYSSTITLDLVAA